MSPRDYDSTVARIAGNIAAGMILDDEPALGTIGYSFTRTDAQIAEAAVRLARLIVKEVKRLERMDAVVNVTQGTPKANP